MTIKIAIILNPDSFLGKLTNFFTGCPAYHIGFCDVESSRFYDMNLLFRRRVWPYYPEDQVEMYECPVEVTKKDLENILETDPDYYGILDYLSFLFRKFPQLIKVKVRNHKGSICSEKVNQILISKGWDSPWKYYDPPPSPCDWRTYLTSVKASTTSVKL